MPVLEESSVSAPNPATSQVAGFSDIAMLIDADNPRASRVSDNPRAIISPSVSIRTVRAMELEVPPEHEKWKIVSKEWYSNDLIGV